MLTLTIDGTEPVSATAVKAVTAVCDEAENRPGPGIVTVEVSGAPAAGWTGGLGISLVTKWERALRRLERLPVATAAVATGDLGGTALEAFLATDVRVATPGTRLLVPVDGEATWPGMALYRLVQQAGAGRVRRAVLFGAPIDTAEALALGLVDELADDHAAAHAAAARLTSRTSAPAGKELAIRRQLLFDATTTSFEQALGAHLAAADRALRGAVVKEVS